MFVQPDVPITIAILRYAETAVTVGTKRTSDPSPRRELLWFRPGVVPPL
jgi:hypothetical protein